jgi:Cysteine-rich secretory protein family
MRVRRLSGRLRWAAPLVVLASSVAWGPAPWVDASGPTPPFIAAKADWLTTVNYYRSMAGLLPVSEDPTLSAGALNHSRYMIGNGTIVHDEVNGGPFWTESGDEAGNNGNVAVSSSVSTTARKHVELWMTGPFHAIGVLRPKLNTVGYGQYDDPAAAPWRSGATLNVIDGLTRDIPDSDTPILFPGDGTTTSLYQFIAETPSPVTFCGWTGSAGLPIVAMLPSAPTDPVGKVTTADGVELEVCTLSQANTSGVGRDILKGDNAVVIMPRKPLTAGTYHIQLATAEGPVEWSFTVDPAAAGSTSPPPPPADLPNTAPTGTPTQFAAVTPGRLVDTRRKLGTSRLIAGRGVVIDVAGRLGIAPAATAVSANFTVVGPDASGYLTVYPCGSGVPEVSTLNFTVGSNIPNQAVVPLDSKGDLCVISSAGTDLIVDVNGGLAATGTDRYSSVNPSRILDTRQGVGGSRRRAANTAFELAVRGRAGVPANATAVAMNVTAVDPEQTGYVTVYPCGLAPEASNLNVVSGQTRPNLVIVRLSGTGSVCLKAAESGMDLLADVAGYFTPLAAAAQFTPLSPLRIVDTRSTDSRINGASGGNPVPAQRVVKVVVAGRRGVPADVDAVSVNLTVTGAPDDGYLTAYPCGQLPNASNVNYAAGVDTANAAQVPVSGSGEICLWASTSMHILVDINGVWG